MFARAAIAVAAGANLVVEGAIYFVLLCAENGGEVTGWWVLVENLTKSREERQLTWPLWEFRKNLRCGKRRKCLVGVFVEELFCGHGDQCSLPRTFEALKASEL